MSRRRSDEAMLLFVTALLASCQTAVDEPARDAVDADWEVGTLAEADIDEARLDALVAEIESQRLENIHSVLIVKDGKLVFERYFEGADTRRGGRDLGIVAFDAERLHDLRSVTKSVTSVLVGIAAGQGALSTDDAVFDHFPEHADLREGAKADITVEHLLLMRSGLAWDETTYRYTDRRNSETAMDFAESSMRYVLEQPLDAAPGERVEYCGGCTMLLAGVVRAATGSDLDDFAETHLFDPLGITDFEWLAHSDGFPIAASGLRLRPRDMAKIGYLFVKEGRWGEEQVIPAEWVSRSTTSHLELDSIAGYGYQWWIDHEVIGDQPHSFPIARGNGGQRIYIIEPLDMVVVITAGNYNLPGGSRHSEQAFWRFILPAAVEGGAGG